MVHRSASKPVRPIPRTINSTTQLAKRKAVREALQKVFVAGRRIRQGEVTTRVLVDGRPIRCRCNAACPVAGWIVAVDLELDPLPVETTEICIAIACDPDCVVTRRGDGLWQRTQVEPGTVWLCSEGVVDEDIRISAWHDILHLWISRTRFQQLGDLTGVPCPPSAVRYLGGIFDEELRRDGANLLAELRRPTASGALLADSLSLSLTTRLAKTLAVRASDERRIQRVVSFMADNLDKEISLDELAGEACLSPFHFIRMFKERMRMPPHRYLSQMRLERAKTQLALGKLPLSAISVMSGFATQSNFTRAFHRVTDVTPLGYRLASQ